jgi:hypothetical protein
LSRPAAIVPPSSGIILPVSSSPAPHVSQSTPGNKNLESMCSSQKSTSEKRDRDALVKSSRGEPSLREITQATDPRLSPEELREKVKKIKKHRKHEHRTHYSHSSRI